MMTTINRKEFVLQICDMSRGGTWVPVAAGAYRDAMRLAESGRFVEALREAYEARVRGWGTAEGSTFRVVVVETSYVTLGGYIGDKASEVRTGRLE